MALSLPSGWTLSASAFNLTPEVVLAHASAPDLARDLVAQSVADTIEIELGQLWRGFPAPATREVTAFRDDLAAVGGRVSIVGASIDDWASGARRRTDDERLEFLRPQLTAAAAVGATGVRLPIGQAGAPLLARLIPLLEEADLVLYEEAQGRQTPTDPGSAEAYETITRLDHPRVRLLLDISMLMPAVPESYLAELERGGVPDVLLHRLRTEWRDPATHDAVLQLLQSGGVPEVVHTLFMNLLVRFGRSSVADVEPVLPLLAGVHLKFWDLDDTDGRVSGPIRELASALRRTDYVGTLCSEWGGHEWLDDDPREITRAHLALARAAITDDRGESFATPDKERTT